MQFVFQVSATTKELPAPGCFWAFLYSAQNASQTLWFDCAENQSLAIVPGTSTYSQVQVLASLSIARAGLTLAGLSHNQLPEYCSRNKV